jgi:hypothetical protein
LGCMNEIWQAEKYSLSVLAVVVHSVSGLWQFNLKR